MHTLRVEVFALPIGPLAALLLAGLAGCSSAPTLPGCHAAEDCVSGLACLAGVCQVVPSVVGRTPDADATGVWWSDPIIVAFSEPIDPASVTDSSVVLSSSSGSLAKTWAVDGATLTLNLTQPPPDARITATLSSQIRDLAGHGLTGAPVSWSWDVPEWLDAAPPRSWAVETTGAFSTAAGPDGSVYALLQMNYGPGFATVSRASRGTWTELGSVGRASGGYLRMGGSIAVDSLGRPLVAFLQRDAGTGVPVVYVSRHDGSSWVALGDALNAAPDAEATAPRLRLDPSDRPVVLWSEGGQLLAKRWSGTAWDSLGGLAVSGLAGYGLALGPSDVISVAYTDATTLRRARVNGGSWDAFGNPLAAAAVADLSLAFDATGAEVVAYAESGAVKVVRWTSGSPGRFDPLGSPLTTTGGSAPSVALRAGGTTGQQLVVAYAENGPRVARWSGASWVSVATTIATPAYPLIAASSQALAVNAHGGLAYAWVENYALGHMPMWTLVAKRYNR